MKTSLPVLLLAVAAAPLLAVPPEITNVRAEQRADTKLVDVWYDAADADGDLLKIRIEVSDNDGVRYSVPAFSLTGDIGEGIAPGAGKHIVWDAGVDWDGEYSDKMRIKVFAVDAKGYPGLEWGDEVPPGGFLLGQDGGAEGSGPSRHVNIPWSYWLSKYEITVGQYCDYLNTALAAGRVRRDGQTAVYAGALERRVFHVQNEEGPTLSDESSSFSIVVNHIPIVPGSVTVRCGSSSFIDNGQGSLTGNAARGSVNYTTGAIAISFYATIPSGKTFVSYDYYDPIPTFIEDLEGSFKLIDLGDSNQVRWNVNKFEVVGTGTNDPVSVTWFGAMAWAQCYGYDLPTEAEWEKAARGPDFDDQDEHCLYTWGNDQSDAKACFGEPWKPVGYYDGNQTPAGPDMMNGFGCYDMTGNACEWTKTDSGYEISTYPQQEDLTDIRHRVSAVPPSDGYCRVAKLGAPIYMRTERQARVEGSSSWLQVAGFRACRRYIPEDESSGD